MPFSFLGGNNGPTLTEKNLPDQSGKVFLVTGSSSGVGLELVEILYSHNAKVYVAARSAAKAQQCIDAITQRHPSSSGELCFLELDLTDLNKVKAAAQHFLSIESRLDILWNNAGVMIPPETLTTAQNHDLQLGVNCIGPFLFTKLLNPLLVRTAESSDPWSVRVIWVSSSAAERFSPPGGVELDNLDYHVSKGRWHRYGVSKAGNILYAAEYANRHKADGVLSLSLDPGNLKTDLCKDMPRYQMFFANLVLQEPIYGAYTELFAGLSKDVSEKDNGGFIIPWGKMGEPRKDIAASMKSPSQSGTGLGALFWEWTEDRVRDYV
ncbi:hypothetical protein EsH8_IX_000180 [Colletotrichum jinshuiense]